MPTLNKWDILSHPAIDWKPHVGQLVVAENPCRHKVLAAGRRFGKSYMGGADKLLPEVFFTRPIANQLLLDGKKRVFWIVGPNFSDSEKEFRVIWNYLKKLEIPMNKPSYNNPETGDMIITLWDGAMQIIAKSAQNPERLVGEGLSGVILSEAAKLKENIWPKYIRPTLADFNGWSFSSSCLTADTLVWTDKGLVELGSMSSERTQGNYDDLYDTTVVGFHGSPETATKFYCNGIQDVLKVVGTNGFSIEGTPNHRVWSMDENGNPGWKYLGDLAIGDYMAVRQGAEIWGDYTADDYEEIDPPQRGRWQGFNTELDCDMAYFMGLFIADGHLRMTDGVITVHGGLDHEIWDWMQDFGFNIRLRKVEGKQDVKVCQLGSFQLRHFMEYMGFVKCKSWEREIPWRARQMPRKLMVQLLAGLFDGDGCYNAKKHKIWYSTTSLKLARQIQSILVNMGIVPNLMKLVAAQEGWQDTYRLELTTHATTKFLQEIPLKIERKAFQDRAIGDLSVSKLPLQQERLLRLKSRYDMRGKQRGAGYSSYGIEPWKNKMAGVSKVRQYLGRVERAYPEAHLDKDFQVLQQLCEEEYVWVEVKSIEAQGKKETFDLCVKNTHSYAANSILSHNTPEGKNWFYELWRNGQDPNNEAWASWRMPAWINNYVYKHPTNEEHVHKLLELSRQTNESVFKLAKKHEFQIDPEILDSINELTPEAFLQEIAADFCADEETEILTQRGWLRYNEVRAGDQTLGMTMNGTVEWTNINRVNIFEAKHRRMVKMVQRAHDSLTTKDHRWLVERLDMNSRRHSDECATPVVESYFVTSEKLGKASEQIVCARPVTNLPVTQKYSDAIVELVAWYWTEGYLRSDGSIDITQDRFANPSKWHRIERALIAEFGNITGRISGLSGWSIHKGNNTFHLRGDFAKAIYQYAPGKEKKVLPQFVTELTEAQLKLFIDTSIAADGWLEYTKDGRREFAARITQKFRYNLDVLQMACQLYGLQTTLTYGRSWKLNIFERNAFRPASMVRSGKRTEIDYFGQVWCPSTGTSTWLARRNGTVYFTGNTEYVGRVFKEFDEEKHVTDLEFNPGWQTFAAVDYGYCVDTETEILTKDGWKRYDEIGYGTECLTLNTETHLAEWGNVKDVKVFDGQWDMVRMKSKSHDSFTTTNHRWFTKWIGNQKNWNWRWTTSDSFKDNDYIPTALPVSNLPETPKYTDALVELVAWYWTEGSRWSKGVGNHKGSLLGGEITHQSAKIKRALISLYGDSDKAGMRQRIPKWHYAFDDRKDFGGAFKLNGPALAPILEHVRGYDKIVSPEFVAALTRSQLELFINTSIEADGAKTGASYIISQAKWQRLEPLQMACQLAGIQTVLRKRDDGYGSLTLFERYNQFNPKRIARQEKWTGRVWCPTTNNGTWLARRNGTVYFTGNCNPNVWLIIQEGPWGEINVLDEIYEEGLDPEDFADEIRWRRLNPANLRYFFPDPADPGASRILEKRLGIKAAGGTGGELNSRINHIRKALREPRHEVEDLYVQNLPPGQIRPRLLFDRRCKRTIEDMLAYRYPEKKVESETSTKRFDSPMKKDDHGPEALGRYFAGRLGQFGKGTGATIHKATFSSKHKEQPIDHRRATKSPEYLRPAAHEKRREDFPIVNDALGNYLSGAYDD